MWNNKVRKSLECRKCKIKAAGWGSLKFSHDEGKPYIQKHCTWNVQHAEDTTTQEPLTRTQWSTDSLCMMTWLAEIFGWEFGLKHCFRHRPPSSSVLYVALLYVRTVTRYKQSYQCLNKCFSRPSESEETGGSHFTAEKHAYMWRDTLWLITLSRKPT